MRRITALAALGAAVITGSFAAGSALADPARAPGHVQHDDAHTDDHRMPMVEPGPDARVPTAAPLDRTGWTATATSTSSDTAAHRATHVLDGRTDTIWHSSYTGRLPQAITVDTRTPQQVSALVYTPRQEGEFNGVAVGYQVATSLDGVTWEPAGSGTWPGDSDIRTAAFDPRPARLARLTITSEAGTANRFATASEIDLLGEPLGAPLPTDGWTATASSAQSGAPAPSALDGDAGTAWRADPAAGLPAWLAVDTGAARTVSGVVLTPPRESSAPRIGSYEVQVGGDGRSWRRVARGTWPAGDAGPPPTRVVGFVPTTARWVRVVVRSDAAGGTSAAVAELALLGAPATPVVDRSRARASASSSRAGQGPARVLDGRTATAWRSGKRRSPTFIALDLRSSYQLSGLRVTPRTGDHVRGYRVQVSADGRRWRSVTSGTWPRGSAARTAYFSRVTARHVRLVLRTPSGKPARSGAVAELEPLGEPTPGTEAGRLGRWSEVVGFPLVPASAVLLPGNRVLGFSAYAGDMYDVDNPSRGYTQIAILDLDTGAVTRREIRGTQHEMFCTGISLLADGRVLITGGSSPSNSTIYDPDTDTWSRADQMEVPRGYQSSATLDDGRVFTLGGSWSGGEGGKDAEVFDPGDGGAGTWSRRPGITATSILTDDAEGIFRADNHGWFFGWRDGRVFHAGPSRQMLWFDTAGQGSVAQAGQRADGADAMNGNAVMYDAGRILTVGGAPDYSSSWATTRASTIDIRGGPGAPVGTAPTGPLAEARTFANSVVLPDGTVLVVGGQQYASPFSDSLATRTPELWSPGTGRFRALAPETIARTYHSAAVLLPDGRVWSGGGGLCQEPCAITTNHLDGQIFTPPYLLTAEGAPRARPRLGQVPRTARPGDRLQVRARTADGRRAVTRLALVRYGSATHSVNTDQRRVALTASVVRQARTGTVRARIPTSGAVVPGDYLLFAIDGAGTPSLARTVRIGAPVTR